VRFVEPLSVLYRCVAPLHAATRRSIGWDECQRRARRLRRARMGPVDTVEISAEAAFRFAALKFDPRHITNEEATVLVCLLGQLGTIDRRTANAFSRALFQLCKTMGSASPNSPQDLIAALDRLNATHGHAWRGKSDILIALEILRTIDIRRRALPSPGHSRSP